MLPIPGKRFSMQVQGSRLQANTHSLGGRRGGRCGAGARELGVLLVRIVKRVEGLQALDQLRGKLHRNAVVCVW